MAGPKHTGAVELEEMESPSGARLADLRGFRFTATDTALWIKPPYGQARAVSDPQEIHQLGEALIEAASKMEWPR